MFTVNVDEMMSIFKSADYFLYKSQDICIQADKNKVYFNINFLDSDLRFEFPVTNSDGLDQIVVSSRDFMKILKIMAGMTKFEAKKNGLAISSTGNEYILQQNKSDFEFFSEFIDNKILEFKVVDNASFKHLQKHCNSDAGNDSDSICNLNGYWYATDMFNTVRVPSKQSSHILINGAYAKFISSVKENFKIGVSDALVVFMNSNFTFTLANGKFTDNMFQDHEKYFGQEYNFVASFDSKSLATKFNNVKTVMSSEDLVQSGMKIGIAQKGYIKVDTDNKYGSESVMFNSVDEELNIIVDADSLDKSLYSCDENIVDLYSCDVGNNERIFKAKSGDVEQIFKGVIV